MCKKWMLRYFPILLSFCHRNPYYQSSACILYPLPVWHVIIVLSPYECPSLIEWKNWDTYFTRSLSLLHHISPQWHLSNPYLGRAGALLPNLLLPGAWRGAGLPLRGWLQQDLQQVYFGTILYHLEFVLKLRICWCTDSRGGVRANIKVTRRDTTVSSMHRWVNPSNNQTPTKKSKKCFFWIALIKE